MAGNHRRLGAQGVHGRKGEFFNTIDPKADIGWLAG
jgi:hypothetical protein